MLREGRIKEERWEYKIGVQGEGKKQRDCGNTEGRREFGNTEGRREFRQNIRVYREGGIQREGETTERMQEYRRKTGIQREGQTTERR
jgi:hypothetical protein